jgi:hypothetical protein
MGRNKNGGVDWPVPSAGAADFQTKARTGLGFSIHQAMNFHSRQLIVSADVTLSQLN